MVSGTGSLGETCQPAWSSSSTACAPGATAWLISSNWAAMASVSQEGRTRPAPLPFFGQIAPNMEAQAVRWSCGAEGRVPRRAQRRVLLFFCPILASSCHHSSISVPSGRPARIASSSTGRLF